MPGNDHDLDTILWEIGTRLRQSSTSDHHLVSIQSVARSTPVIDVYVIYASDADVVTNERSGISDLLTRRFLQALAESPAAPVQQTKAIAFHFDSEETVTRDFQGSYTQFLGLFY